MYVQEGADDGVVVVVDADVDLDEIAGGRGKTGFETENLRAIAQCDGADDLCSPGARCVNRTTTFEETGRAYGNAALGSSVRTSMVVRSFFLFCFFVLVFRQPTHPPIFCASAVTTRAATPCCHPLLLLLTFRCSQDPTSRFSSVAVDGQYPAGGRLVTLGEGKRVVPISVSSAAPSSSSRRTGAFVSPIGMNNIVLKGGWLQKQASTYCTQDFNTKCIGTLAQKNANGCLLNVTLPACKQSCKQTSGCRGISYKVGNIHCVLVTLTTHDTCSGTCGAACTAAWSTHWFRDASRYNDVFTMSSGGYVDTGIGNPAKELRTIAFYMKASKIPTDGVYELVSKHSSWKGVKTRLTTSGDIIAQTSSGSAQASGSSEGTSKYVKSDGSISLNQWYHVAATFDPVPSGGSCPPTHPFVYNASRTCCKSNEGKQDCAWPECCKDDQYIACDSLSCVDTPRIRLYVDGKEQVSRSSTTTIPQDSNGNYLEPLNSVATGGTISNNVLVGQWADGEGEDRSFQGQIKDVRKNLSCSLQLFCSSPRSRISFVFPFLSPSLSPSLFPSSLLPPNRCAFSSKCSRPRTLPHSPETSTLMVRPNPERVATPTRERSSTALSTLLTTIEARSGSATRPTKTDSAT